MLTDGRLTGLLRGGDEPLSTWPSSMSLFELLLFGKIWRIGVKKLTTALRIKVIRRGVLAVG